MKPRVRFAPSPTGYLHIGGARTALFNWLYARRFGGTFVLRIEDTDQKRSTPESLQAVLDAMKWLGLTWDEGPGVGGPFPPYFQMEKLARYASAAQELIDAGWAYRDYSTEDELKAARNAFAQSKGLKEGDDLRSAGFKYTSPWRDKKETRSEPCVIRFKMPTREGSFGFDDMIGGRIEKPFDDLDDFVLIRKDGVPLYNFGCVIDDHDMQITLVGRGQEHVNSTFPQLMIYEAFKWTPPQFAHLPLIMSGNEKLSKRKHPEADVMQHQKAGVLPHALLNYIVRLGWSHGDKELFTLQEMVDLFDFKDCGRSSGSWDQVKLTATNEHWLKASDAKAIATQLLPFLEKAGVKTQVDARLERGVLAFRERSKTLVEMADKLKPYFATGVTLDAAAAAKHLTPEGKAMLGKAKEFLAAVTEWTQPNLDPVVDHLANATGAKKGAIAQPIRVAVTGNTVSPGIGDTLELLGRDEALARIDAALR